MGIADDARLALLSRLIDHAPLFPPASMELSAALVEDAHARGSGNAFMLGRFVCPASRLDELPDLARGISVVLDGPFEADGRVESVETPLHDDHDDLDALAGLAREVYVEIPLDDDLDARLDELAARGLRAKVRCGGARVPEAHQLAEFLRGCREHHVVFKATAGLHQAVRRDGEHGFLNLLAAVVFGDEVNALEEQDSGAFALDRERFTWRDRSARAEDLSRARRERFHSFGSCSFFEPVDELGALGMLPL